MEIRKVQITGGSSYVITLPKDWAESLKIKKNDPLGLVVQPDGTLLVTKDITEVQVQRAKKFDVTTIHEPAYLFRLLIGSYIAGYTTIEISSKNRLPASVRMVVRDFTQMTIGPEVVEETDNSVVLKDLLNPLEMPFNNTIKRMYVIVKNMYLDAMNVLETRNTNLADDVAARDNDVDRLHWLVARQSNIILKNANLSRKMAVSTSMVINTYVISRIIERIGDHAVRWVDNARKMPEGELPEDLMESVRTASALSLALFDKSIVTYFKSDIREANKNIEQIGTLEAACEKINSLAMNQEPLTAISLRNIAESIRRAGEYSVDISENVINYLVESKV